MTTRSSGSIPAGWSSSERRPPSLLIHGYAWRHLRGRALGKYLLETAGIYALLAGIFFLPRPVREWSLFGPLIVVALLHNVQNVFGHLDLPFGKYHDTWQLVLPRWISVWMLNIDHHLEHHICPRMHWYELPDVRARLASESGVELHRVTMAQFLTEVFLRGAKSSRYTTASAGEDLQGSGNSSAGTATGRCGVVAERRLPAVGAAADSRSNALRDTMRRRQAIRTLERLCIFTARM